MQIQMNLIDSILVKPSEMCFFSCSDDTCSIIPESLILESCSSGKNVKIHITCTIKDFCHLMIKILGVLVDSKLNLNPQCTLVDTMGNCVLHSITRVQVSY